MASDELERGLEVLWLNAGLAEWQVEQIAPKLLPLLRAGQAMAEAASPDAKLKTEEAWFAALQAFLEGKR